ncbi:single-stranded DNA-binding protein [Calothrix sp. HK-06]|nr:single-stranded DNA-binding protein [Calothrix sp. HK-06]
MNNFILMAEIISEPQLRHTQDGLEISEMMVQFPASRQDDPPSMLRVVSWRDLAKEVHQNYHQGDRVLLEGRLGMNTIDRPEGFKEKRAELTLQKIHSLDGSAPMSSAPAVERTPVATSTKTSSNNSNRQAASSASSDPSSYDEAPARTPAAKKSNVGVMPEESKQYTTQSATTKNYEPSTYPAQQEADTDEDDIPF